MGKRIGSFSTQLVWQKWREVIVKIGMQRAMSGRLQAITSALSAEEIQR
jgi:hypothetical protein